MGALALILAASGCQLWQGPTWVGGLDDDQYVPTGTYEISCPSQPHYGKWEVHVKEGDAVNPLTKTKKETK